jgi:hypothetical protein
LVGIIRYSDGELGDTSVTTSPVWSESFVLLFSAQFLFNFFIVLLENFKVVNELSSVDGSWSWGLEIVGGVNDIVVVGGLLGVEGEWGNIIFELSVVSSS